MSKTSQKILKTLMLATLAALLGSCSSEEVTDISLETPGKVLLIKSKAPSCSQIFTAATTEGAEAALDVPEKYITIRNPVIKWKDTTRDLIVSYIHVTLKGPRLSAQYDCVISEDELKAVYSYVPASGLPKAWSLEIAKAPSASSPSEMSAATVKSQLGEPLCAMLRCGGITLSEEDDSKPFQMQATVEIVGVAVDPVSKEETGVRSKSSITVENLF